MNLWLDKIGRRGAAVLLCLVAGLNLALAEEPDSAWQAAFDRMKSLAAEGRYEEAISAGSRALELAESAQGPGTRERSCTGSATSIIRTATSRPPSGFCAAPSRFSIGPTAAVSVSLARILNNLGYVLTDLERFAEAERIFRTHVSVLEELSEQEITQLGTAHKNLGRLYDHWNRPENAEPVNRAGRHYKPISPIPRHPTQLFQALIGWSSCDSPEIRAELLKLG